MQFRCRQLLQTLSEVVEILEFLRLSNNGQAASYSLRVQLPTLVTFCYALDILIAKRALRFIDWDRSQAIWDSELGVIGVLERHGRNRWQLLAIPELARGLPDRWGHSLCKIDVGGALESRRFEWLEWAGAFWVRSAYYLLVCGGEGLHFLGTFKCRRVKKGRLRLDRRLRALYPTGLLRCRHFQQAIIGHLVPDSLVLGLFLWDGTLILTHFY